MSPDKGKTKINSKENVGSKDILKNNTKDGVITNGKETMKGNVRETNKSSVKETTKTNIKEITKGHTKGINKSFTKEVNKNNIKEAVKNNVKETNKNAKEILKNNSKELIPKETKCNTKDINKASIKTNLKETLQETVKNGKNNVKLVRKVTLGKTNNLKKLKKPEVSKGKSDSQFNHSEDIKPPIKETIEVSCRETRAAKSLSNLKKEAEQRANKEENKKSKMSPETKNDKPDSVEKMKKSKCDEAEGKIKLKTAKVDLKNLKKNDHNYSLEEVSLVKEKTLRKTYERSTEELRPTKKLKKNVVEKLSSEKDENSHKKILNTKEIEIKSENNLKSESDTTGKNENLNEKTSKNNEAKLEVELKDKGGRELKVYGKIKNESKITEFKKINENKLIDESTKINSSKILDEHKYIKIENTKEVLVTTNSDNIKGGKFVEAMTKKGKIGNKIKVEEVNCSNKDNLEKELIVNLSLEKNINLTEKSGTSPKENHESSVLKRTDKSLKELNQSLMKETCENLLKETIASSVKGRNKYSIDNKLKNQIKEVKTNIETVAKSPTIDDIKCPIKSEIKDGNAKDCVKLPIKDNVKNSIKENIKTSVKENDKYLNKENSGSLVQEIHSTEKNTEISNAKTILLNKSKENIVIVTQEKSDKNLKENKETIKSKGNKVENRQKFETQEKSNDGNKKVKTKVQEKQINESISQEEEKDKKIGGGKRIESKTKIELKNKNEKTKAKVKLKEKEVKKNIEDNQTTSNVFVSQRPTRKTKEAAAIYMEILGHKLVNDGDIDDSESFDSFPELPNVRKTEQRENELKAKAINKSIEENEVKKKSKNVKDINKTESSLKKQIREFQNNDIDLSSKEISCKDLGKRNLDKNESENKLKRIKKLKKTRNNLDSSETYSSDSENSVKIKKPKYKVLNKSKDQKCDSPKVSEDGSKVVPKIKSKCKNSEEHFNDSDEEPLSKLTKSELIDEISKDTDTKNSIEKEKFTVEKIKRKDSESETKTKNLKKKSEQVILSSEKPKRECTKKPRNYVGMFSSSEDEERFFFGFEYTEMKEDVQKSEKKCEHVAPSLDLLCKEGRRFGKTKMSTEQIEKWLKESAMAGISVKKENDEMLKFGEKIPTEPFKIEKDTTVEESSDKGKDQKEETSSPDDNQKPTICERKSIFRKEKKLPFPNVNAFSPNNESSVYAFEADTEDSVNTPFRRPNRRPSSTATSRSEDDLSKQEECKVFGMFISFNYKFVYLN